MPNRDLPTVFLDDGEVLNDTLGARPNGKSFSVRMDSFSTHGEYQRDYDLAWARGTCEFVDVSAPSTTGECSNG